MRTWPRVAPAARSRPTSRVRSMTVIESVLRMRNAPAKRAIAAISAVVADEVGGRGSERGGELGRRPYDVRLDQQPRPRSVGRPPRGRRRSRARRRPASRPAGRRPPGPSAAARPRCGRPRRRAARRRARMPTTRYSPGSPAPSTVERGADRQAIVARESLGDEGLRRLARGERGAVGRAASRGAPVSAAGSTPRIVTDAGSSSVDGRRRRGRSDAPAPARPARRPAVVRDRARVSGPSPVSPNADDAQVAPRPRRSLAVRSARDIDAGVRREAGEQHADAERHARRSSTRCATVVRGGSATRSPVRPRIAGPARLEAQPGEPRDERTRVVGGPSPEAGSCPGSVRPRSPARGRHTRRPWSRA